MPLFYSLSCPELEHAKRTMPTSLLAFQQRFKRPGLIFGAHQWDAATILEHAVPIALTKGKPGTPEFRVALRDAIEGLKDIALIDGIASYSPTDHNGYDERARALMRIEGGKFVLIK